MNVNKLQNQTSIKREHETLTYRQQWDDCKRRQIVFCGCLAAMAVTGIIMFVSEPSLVKHLFDFPATLASGHTIAYPPRFIALNFIATGIGLAGLVYLCRFRCPRCHHLFFIPASSSRGEINLFTRKCANCDLPKGREYEHSSDQEGSATGIVFTSEPRIERAHETLTYRQQWEDCNRRQTVFFSCWIGWPVLGVVVSSFFPRSYNNLLFEIICIPDAVLFVVAGLWLTSFRCPRCGEPFFQRSLLWGLEGSQMSLRGDVCTAAFPKGKTIPSGKVNGQNE